MWGGEIDQRKQGGLWALNLVGAEHRWEQITTKGQEPPRRTEHRMVSHGGRLIVFGGESGVNSYFSDLHVLVLSASSSSGGGGGKKGKKGKKGRKQQQQQQQQPASASSIMTGRWKRIVAVDSAQRPFTVLRRTSSAACVTGDRLFIHGGNTDCDTGCATLEVVDLADFTWSRPTLRGEPPLATSEHSMIETPSGGGVLVFGGYIPQARRHLNSRTPRQFNNLR